MYFTLLLLLKCFSLASTAAIEYRARFIKDFIEHQGRTASVVSFLRDEDYQNIKFCKATTASNVKYSARLNPNVLKYNNNIYIADYQQNNTKLLLYQANKTGHLIYPARWMIFYDIAEKTNENSSPHDANSEIENAKRDIKASYAELSIGVDSEVYVAFAIETGFQVCLVYKIRPHLPLLWEEYALWYSLGFDRRHPEAALAMRRRDLRRSKVVSTAVYFNNQSYLMADNFLHREVDTLSKLIHYMTRHLFEWMNATGLVNTSDSWGYLRSDGTYDGIVRELYDGRSDFSSTVLIPMQSRLAAVEYVLPPSPLNLNFIFRKPTLASVANIYVMPFSEGVWAAVCGLVLVSAAALVVTSYREMNPEHKVSLTQRVSEAVHDTLSLVFQQGTASDPVSVSSRQILILGLMAFMFLYTAYSANVVALLQSATNNINSVEALLRSPLQIGAEDVVYNKQIFEKETRPVHRALWLSKGVPQGDKFFLPVAEGIRKLRKGMYAFHVEPTAGFSEIQRTFLEHEKCNLGEIKYTEFIYPYFGISRISHIKEALRVGVIRIMESGVQTRSNRRAMEFAPRCGAGAAMFTPVRMMDIAPALQIMCVLYTSAVLILGLEVYVHRRETLKNGARTKEENNQSL